MSTLASLAFHHMGLAVRDDSAALSFLSALGYIPGEKVLDPLQNVRVRLCTAIGRPTVEIVQPAGEGPSPVDRLISQFNEIIYHTCYSTSDFERTLAGLGEAGLRVQTLSEPRPAVLFGGRLVSFHRVVGFGIIELLQD